MNPNDRNELDYARAREPFDPRRGVNHASAAVRVLERRIARLEAAVFPHQEHINRSRPPVTEVHRNGVSHDEDASQ
jgi:hypothetical protein